MKRILTIIREPFLDRIPSLKTLLLDLCENGCEVILVTSRSKRFGPLTTVHANLRVITIDERSRKLDVPTTFKLLLKSMAVLLRKKIDCVIGGDAWGM